MSPLRKFTLLVMLDNQRGMVAWRGLANLLCPKRRPGNMLSLLSVDI